MDYNNNSQGPKRRVTRKMAQKRRAVAIFVFILIIILIILLFVKCCSNSGEKKKPANPTGQTTTVPTSPTLDITTPTPAPTTVPVPTADPNDPNTITKIDLSMYEVYLEVGGAPKMPIVSMTPSTSTQKGEIWTSSDETVATVDWRGDITAVGAGECVVTVTSENNPSVYAEVRVVVTSPYDNPANAAGQTPSATTAALQ